MKAFPFNEIKRGLRLLGSLLSCSLIAFTVARLDWHGVVNLGLSWTSRPGPILFCISLLLAGYAILRKLPAQQTIQGFVFYAIPLFLEFTPIGRYYWMALGISSTIFGWIIVCKAQNEYLWKGFWFLEGAYIQSVFIYDLFAPDQLMTFFRGGWTT